MNHNLSEEERDILRSFERNELTTAADAEREMESAQEAAL